MPKPSFTEPFVLRVARKDHTCLLCGQPIQKGEHYHDARLGPMHHPENDHWFKYRAHEECHHYYWETFYESGDCFPEPSEFIVYMQQAQMSEFGLVEGE